ESLKGRVEALYVPPDPLFTTNRVRFNTLALNARLPTMHGTREHVDAGGLISYGSNQTDLFRRAGDYVDKILRGAKPGDIPVEQPTKFDLVINLAAAKALGLEIPPTLLARADEVIERSPTPSLPGLTRQSILVRKKMDARVISAFTRVFRRAMPADDGSAERATAHRRRAFIMLIGAAAAWPLAARAQQSGPMPLIGYVSSQSQEYDGPRLAALRQSLSEAGYVEGASVAIEYRWAEGNYDRLAAQAAEFVRRRAAVIFAGSLPAALAAKAATTTIPIVFVMGADPVKLGVVA